MLEDVLQAAEESGLGQKTVVVSSDPAIEYISAKYQAKFLLTSEDGGYSEDALLGVNYFIEDDEEALAIIPADVPQVSALDFSRLMDAHGKGITLCPAIADGGTNALVFDPPLMIPLVFGLNSLSRFQQVAEQQAVSVKVLTVEALARDIDTPEDLQWLKSQQQGGKSWEYLQQL